jgi:hypothetical protein
MACQRSSPSSIRSMNRTTFGSPNPPLAMSNETPCFSRFVSFLALRIDSDDAPQDGI